MLPLAGNAITFINKPKGIIEIGYTADHSELAIEYINNSNNKSACLITMDLNVQRMNGIEHLKYLKTYEDLKRIPAAVPVTSDEESDKLRCFSYNVAGYLVKPVNCQEFELIINSFMTFWTLNRFI